MHKRVQVTSSQMILWTTSSQNHKKVGRDHKCKILDANDQMIMEYF